MARARGAHRSPARDPARGARCIRPRPTGAPAVRVRPVERRLVRVLRRRTRGDLGRRACADTGCDRADGVADRSRCVPPPGLANAAPLARAAGGRRLARAHGRSGRAPDDASRRTGRRLAARLGDPAGAVSSRRRPVARRRLRDRPHALAARDRGNRRRHRLHRPVRIGPPVGRPRRRGALRGVAVHRPSGGGRERLGERPVARRGRPAPVHGTAVDGPRRRRPRAPPSLTRRALH